MPDDFIPRRSGAIGPFQTRKVAGGLDGGPLPDTPESSWLWLKERLQGGNQISLQYDEEDRLIVINATGGALAWGSITGTLSHQTDLQTALNGKAATTHTHAIAQVTNLQASLDAKAALTQVVRHDALQSLNSAAKLRAARNVGSLVTLSAELRGPDSPWIGAGFNEWLWTLPADFAVWDVSLAVFSNSIDEEWTCEAQILDSFDNQLWGGSFIFSPGIALSSNLIAGSLSFPTAQP